MAHVNRGWTYFDRVPATAAGRSVLDFYVEQYPHSPAAAWAERLRRGQVTADGRPLAGDERLVAGQLLQYHRPPWPEQDVPTDVTQLYADAHLLAVGKPSGLPTLPGGDYLDNTLLHLVRARYGADLAPLHRLGRATSGIVLFARSAPARRRLSADLREGRLRKVYRALVVGIPAKARFCVEVPVGPVPYAPLGWLHAATPGGAPARSLVRVVQARHMDGQTLVEVEIPTGRPHQIRIHLAAAGYPLAGDPLYGPGGVPKAPLPGQRPALPGDGGYHLHAWRVELRHPADSTLLALSCAPPEILRTAGESASGV